MSIKRLRSNGLSYREISIETNWSKATVSRGGTHTGNLMLFSK